MGVAVTRQGTAAVVTMQWPEQRNALGPDEASEVATALREAASNPEAVGVVLTGEGAFCAGGNLKGAVTRQGMSPEERRTLVYGAYQGLIRTLLDLPLPTVAAIDGPAVGMGLDIALACDSRFVGPDGWLSQGWGRMSLVPATGGVLLLGLRAPNALWRILEDQPRLDGSAAEQLGIAESSGTGSALERSIERLDKLSSMSRAALSAYAELSRDLLRRNLDEHLAVGLRHQLELLADPDFRSRVAKVLS
jgi:2-(1,2-epoxy-1,2-dihydrophenyl)acetyl-CoA isomerase